MRSICLSWMLLCLISFAGHTQEVQPSEDTPEETAVTLHWGDQAPPLRMRAWLKGKPVERFEKGQVYVLEFWATWCRPCKAAMPRLSLVANKYKGPVTIIGVDIREFGKNYLPKVRTFVDSMGSQMDYLVAADDSNYMFKNWFKAAGGKGIPATIVVNQEGKIAWTGHPKDLEQPLAKILNHSWDIEQELAQRKEQKRSDSLDLEAHYALLQFRSFYRKDSLAAPDSALLAIEVILRNEPKLKYAPRVAYETFSSLLQVDQEKAYAYGKEALDASSDDCPVYESIVSAIETFKDKLPLSPAIYRLGADARQMLIDSYPYPEIVDLHKSYSKMAEWYARAGDKAQAVAAMEKSIGILKTKKGIPPKVQADFEAQLQRYRSM